MKTTRYRLSFAAPEVPGGWVQAVAATCAVHVQRAGPRHGDAHGSVVTDVVSLVQAAEHVAGRAGPRVELVCGGIVRCDDAFLPWVQGRFRAPPLQGALVVAQFDVPEDVGGWDAWQAWGRYDCAVAVDHATVTGLDVEYMPRVNAVVMRLTVAAPDLHRSAYPSPVVPPLDLLPGTIFFPYVPLQISSVYSTEEKS
jgi:hypothetical protein